jgi:hypothetical protein
MDFPVWTSINQLRTIPVTPDHFDGTLRIAAANGTPSITLYIDHDTESDANYLIAGTVRQDEDPDFDLSLELGSNMEFLGAKYQNHPSHRRIRVPRNRRTSPTTEARFSGKAYRPIEPARPRQRKYCRCSDDCTEERPGPFARFNTLWRNYGRSGQS